MKPPTLLLDLDGTLTDNFAGISRSILHALQRLAIAAPPEDALRGCVGPPLRQSLARLLDTDDAARIEHALALYRERYATIGWTENVVYPGIPELLSRLRGQRTELYLCTAKPQVFAQRIVERFAIAPHLAGIYGAGLDPALDDKGKLVARILDEVGEPGRTFVMIGDREHDMWAARANGIAAIGVLWGYGTRTELLAAGADAIVAAPEELESALANVAAFAGAR